MSEKIRTISNKAGLPPGALIHIGRKKSDQVYVSVIDFDDQSHEAVVCDTIDDCFAYRDSESVTWINIDGLHDTAAIGKIGDHFKLHPLMLEDILNTRNRPDYEDFGDSIFFSLKMFGIKEDNSGIVSEQISLVMGANWIISFQEQQGDIFSGLRERIKSNKGVIRKKGVDYLYYRLIDTIVDHYFFVTEFMNESIEELEAGIGNIPDDQALESIQRLRKELIFFRRGVGPLRDALGNLKKDPSEMFGPDTIPFVKDVQDHVAQVSDTIDVQRDMLSGLMDLHHSNVSARMNKVMQLLTIISSIFIPLTFIAGIYGMNFQYMPELQWEYGYATVWILMLGIIAGLIVYFKRKGWL